MKITQITPSACAPDMPKSSACWCWALYEKKRRTVQKERKLQSNKTHSAVLQITVDVNRTTNQRNHNTYSTFRVSRERYFRAPTLPLYMLTGWVSFRCDRWTSITSYRRCEHCHYAWSCGCAAVTVTVSVTLPLVLVLASPMGGGGWGWVVPTRYCRQCSNFYPLTHSLSVWLALPVPLALHVTSSGTLYNTPVQWYLVSPIWAYRRHGWWKLLCIPIGPMPSISRYFIRH